MRHNSNLWGIADDMAPIYAPSPCFTASGANRTAVTRNLSTSHSTTGEPNIATLDGQEYLFFVYAVVRGVDAATGLPDLDMQTGYVKRSPP